MAEIWNHELYFWNVNYGLIRIDVREKWKRYCWNSQCSPRFVRVLNSNNNIKKQSKGNIFDANSTYRATVQCSEYNALVMCKPSQANNIIYYTLDVKSIFVIEKEENHSFYLKKR